jgi:Tfp pilus assembly protein PilE
MSKNDRYTKRTGTSLVELVVVIAIVSIVIAVAGVSYSTLNAPQLDTNARKIASDITWAKERAITIHQHHAIRFNTANKSYAIYKTPTGTTADIVPANLLKTAFVDMSMSLILTDLWIYAPKGNTFGTAAVTLTRSGKTRIISISRETGNVKIQ